MIIEKFETEVVIQNRTHPEMQVRVPTVSALSGSPYWLLWSEPQQCYLMYRSEEWEICSNPRSPGDDYIDDRPGGICIIKPRIVIGE